MSKAELKPCPFCGKAVVLTHGEINSPEFDGGDYTIKWSISCKHCEMAKIKRIGKYALDDEGNLVSVDKEDVKKLITDTWNRRI